MDQSVLELYPKSGTRHDLRKLYLADLPDRGSSGEPPFIYSNYITSLDGRIAVPLPDHDTHQVPPAIANARDWRLFQELAAQADILITTARYFRQAEKQQAQAELPLANAPEFNDLHQWRTARGLPAQPDIAIFSASLNIPPATLEPYQNRKLYILTTERADRDKLQRLRDTANVEIITCGNSEEVNASRLRTKLGQLGYHRVYAIAGPRVLHTLIKAGALDRLYLTTAHVLLGGTRFDTMVTGPQLVPAKTMPLRTMYLDTESPEGAGQTMSIYGI
jgi:riboflavin biosynthesis pyrimidine reductase